MYCFDTSYLCGQKSWDLDGSISGPSHANFCVYIWWPVNCGKKRCMALNIHDMWQGIVLDLVHTSPGLIACQHVISISFHGEHLPPWYFFEPSLQSREEGQGGPIVYGKICHDPLFVETPLNELWNNLNKIRILKVSLKYCIFKSYQQQN